MFEMFLNSVTLFLKGKLFQEPRKVTQKALVGIAIAAILLIVLVMAGLGVWLAVILASLIAGAIQPWLFKDLKYR